MAFGVTPGAARPWAGLHRLTFDALRQKIYHSSYSGLWLSPSAEGWQSPENAAGKAQGGSATDQIGRFLALTATHTRPGYPLIVDVVTQPCYSAARSAVLISKRAVALDRLK